MTRSRTEKRAGLSTSDVPSASRQHCARRQPRKTEICHVGCLLRRRPALVPPLVDLVTGPYHNVPVGVIGSPRSYSHAECTVSRHCRTLARPLILFPNTSVPPDTRVAGVCMCTEFQIGVRTHRRARRGDDRDLCWCTVNRVRACNHLRRSNFVEDWRYSLVSQGRTVGKNASPTG